MTGTSARPAAMTEAYDSAAGRYADFARGELDQLPLDRAVLAAFADYVRAAGGGLVADLGCGPGRITAHLRELGLGAFGLDLSPAMIDLARSEHPGLRFEVGSMDALELADGALGGIVSWYSVIHAPPGELPAYFAEFARVLAPGGHLPGRLLRIRRRAGSGLRPQSGAGVPLAGRRAGRAGGRGGDSLKSAGCCANPASRSGSAAGTCCADSSPGLSTPPLGACSPPGSTPPRVPEKIPSSAAAPRPVA